MYVILTPEEPFERCTKCRLPTRPHRPAFQFLNNSRSNSSSERGSLVGDRRWHNWSSWSQDQWRDSTAQFDFFLVQDNDVVDACVFIFSSEKALASTESTTERFRPQEMAPSQSPTGVQTMHIPERHISRARPLIIYLALRRIVWFIQTSSTDCVKKGFCSDSDSHQSLSRCHSRTTQTIRPTSKSTPSATTRSPSPAGQTCPHTLAR